jgi:diguanylate cyclase (GGDEF)-like protein
MPSALPTATIARLHGEFACAATERDFLRQQSATMLRHLRLALMLCSVVYLAFGINDVAQLGLPKAWWTLAARAAPALVALLGLRYAARPEAPVRAVLHASSAFGIVWMASFLVVVAIRPQVVLLHALSVTIMAMVVHIFLPNRPLHALAIAFGGTVGFVALVWYQGHEPTRQMVSMSLLICAAHVFGAIAANRHAQLWREQYLTQRDLTALSTRDPLTGCYNRHHLNAALLDGAIARARRDGRSLCLIMCDLDGFKAINDTHGHLAGDDVLRRFAALLQDMTREGIDTVVRYGGEEFLVILPETDLYGAVALAERLRAAFAAERIVCDGAHIGTTASFGVVGADFAAGCSLAPRSMVAAADALMYEAKRGGRNQVRARALLEPAVGKVA